MVTYFPEKSTIYFTTMLLFKIGYQVGRLAAAGHKFYLYGEREPGLIPRHPNLTSVAGRNFWICCFPLCSVTQTGTSSTNPLHPRSRLLRRCQ